MTGFPLPAMGLAEVMDFALRYLFAMLRIGAFMTASPAFGGRFVPLPVRIAATVVLALPVVQAGGLPAPETLATLAGVRPILGEIIIGLLSGMVMTVLFGAAVTAGDRIAATAGLGFAAQFDPAGGGQTPVVGQMFGIFLLMIYLGANGHLAALRILYESYQAVPPGSALNLPAMIATALTTGTALFALALSIAFPAVAILTLLNLAIGVITRSAPQLNIFAFGFPLTMAATLILMWVLAPAMAAAMEHVVDGGLAAMTAIIGAAHG